VDTRASAPAHRAIVMAAAAAGLSRNIDLRRFGDAFASPSNGRR
jgi:hypothetical protein